MTTRALLLATLLSPLFGCQSQGNGEDSLDLSDLPFLAPVAAEAVVQVGGTYYFPSAFDPNFDELLNTCTVSLNAALEPVPETVLANFQRALPRGNDDFFSIQIQGDFVSWGLLDKESGEEWVSRPGGTLAGKCKIIPLEGTDLAQCDLSWAGEASRVREPQIRQAVVEMSCFFGAVPVCQLACGDGNSCTIDTCIPESGCVSVNRPEVSICDFAPGVDGRCTADGDCVITISR